MKTMKQFISEQKKIKTWSDVFNYVSDLPNNAEIKFPSNISYEQKKEWTEQLISGGMAQMTTDPKSSGRMFVLTKLD